jgi:Arc/MetJ-type ribon-helix-helix transcriptional regulator
VTDAAGSLPAEPPPAWGAPAPAADPARLAQRYIETADALVNEQRYASALVVLRALQPADQQRPEVLGLRRRIWAGLEPEVSRRAVDDRILAAVLAGADAAAGDGR